MTPGTLIYKCRNCGKAFEAAHTPDVVISLVALVNGHKQPFEGTPVGITEIHNCEDGSLGVADLIAGKHDEK